MSFFKTLRNGERVSRKNVTDLSPDYNTMYISMTETEKLRHVHDSFSACSMLFVRQLMCLFVS